MGTEVQVSDIAHRIPAVQQTPRLSPGLKIQVREKGLCQGHGALPICI